MLGLSKTEGLRGTDFLITMNQSYIYNPLLMSFLFSPLPIEVQRLQNQVLL